MRKMHVFADLRAGANGGPGINHGALIHRGAEGHGRGNRRKQRGKLRREVEPARCGGIHPVWMVPKNGVFDVNLYIRVYANLIQNKSKLLSTN